MMTFERLEQLAKAHSEGELEAALLERRRLANRIVVTSDEEPLKAGLVST
jgi:hypothetical protein